jgi:hypothetical protein
MWNWLMDCYRDGSLTIQDLEDVMKHDGAACKLWEDWSECSRDFIDEVRSEVRPFLDYLKKKGKYEKEGCS